MVVGGAQQRNRSLTFGRVHKALLAVAIQEGLLKKVHCLGGSAFLRKAVGKPMIGNLFPKPSHVGNQTFQCCLWRCAH